MTPASALVLRRACPGDAVPLWDLANDSTVRQNAFNSEPVVLADHLQWYARKLESPATCIWVLAKDDLVVAQVRYDRVEPDVAGIDIAVVSAHRGQGLGRRLLADTWRLACVELGVSRVRGLVLPANAASARAFAAAGFERTGEAVVANRTCEVFERRASDDG